MIQYHYPLIAREGWGVIFTFVGGAMLSQLFGYGDVSIALWIMMLLSMLFFRDPRRIVPPIPLALVAPVDGKIVSVEEMDETPLERRAICISIKKPWYKTISIRSPMEGKVQKQWRHRQNENEPDSEDCEFVQWVQSDEGDDVTMHILPLFAKRLFRCYTHAGERIGQGQRCGVFYLSAIVTVLIPQNATVAVHQGDKVTAGSDIIANLVH